MSDITASSSHTEPEDNQDDPVNIESLQMEREANILEARVYRKWICPGSPPTFCCMLIDRQGAAIQGNVDYKNMNYFNQKCFLNKAYRILNFIVEPTKKYQQTLQNEISLRFGLRTDFQLLKDKEDEFPEHHFEFIAHNQLPSRVPYIDEQTGQTVFPILTDYLGRLRSVSDVTPFGNPTTGQSYRRKLQIENLDGSEVELTMWDELAKQFDKKKFLDTPFPAIIAVSSCRVSTYRGSAQLSATSATHYGVNLKIQEVADARRLFKEKYNVVPPLQVVNYPYTDIEQEKARNRENLRTLLHQDPANYKTVRFTCEAMITAINSNKSWNYLSCKECNKMSTNVAGIQICADHGRQIPPPHKYNFRAKVVDGTGTAEFTFFNEAGRKITTHNCEDVVSRFKPTPEKQMPSEIMNIIGRRHIFQIQFATNSQKGSGRFTVNDILDIPRLPATQNTGASMAVIEAANENTDVAYVSEKDSLESSIKTPDETDDILPSATTQNTDASIPIGGKPNEETDITYTPETTATENAADTEDESTAQTNLLPGTPPHAVTETFATNVISTPQHKKDTSTTKKSKPTSSKRSLNTALAMETKKKKSD